MPTITDSERVITNCALLLKMAVELEIPYLVTEQNPRGLGRTVRQIDAAMSDVSMRGEKNQFSALVDIVGERLHAWRRPTVIVAGIEAHVCILQTALDLQSPGRQTVVCTDAISAGQRDQIGPALRRMEAAGAVPTGVVSLMYELMGSSDHPRFRACLELAKAVQR